MKKTLCPVFKTDLTNYVFGELLQKRSEAIREHLETCEACRAEVAAQTAVRDGLRAALQADAQAPCALTPERLAAVLATPPAEGSRGRSPSKHSKQGGERPREPKRPPLPWGRILGWAATLVFFLGIFSAALRPAGRVMYKVSGIASILDDANYESEPLGL
jgi:anti-sigma factor RsiW